ncbi:glycosyl transferase family 2 [Nonlabens arenilitoris]|uniref:Glycosyl transferase family 2 n=1 Tax=Nonlabens arenilitoris TaxID=1217969 RepID=A0A2S7UDZ1_9FLAO|nr:glycosyltransferase [Nonlabens arenilitoris]PQJ33099.1 glycosyl transferase family 2 [Nonlabens arenilitoris]
MELNFSFIVPVYNRPEEVEKLLISISRLDYNKDFEVVIVEDGSTLTCEAVCSRFRESVNISYFFKSNSGPGESRNYGMCKAKGNYFIILDSDCILPKGYLQAAESALQSDYVDCYGGPDAAHESFTSLQKAINYSMTSFFTTGGIRGGSEQLDKFQPRSFNMGLSKEAFLSTEGFGKIHPGEDPDLSIRLWKSGYRTRLIKDAYVYHERRISWKLFYKQVHKFGMVRVILNKWYPDSAKVIYWLPSLFIIGLLFSMLTFLAGYVWLLYAVMLYFLLIFIDSSIKNGVKIGLLSIYAVFIQFTGYGYGFFKSYFYLNILKKEEKNQFPQLFFK